MLLHLHIRDFAIVPSLEQDFLPGFTAISGETGAGKSILVDALGLLLGARSDSQWVMAGADRAELTAEFSITANAAARNWLREQELDSDETCLLRRTIQAGGRSRAWVNGTPVTVQQLAELGNLLVEVHGQNEHIRLTGARRQLQLLDETGNHDHQLAAVAEAHAHWQACRTEYETQQARAALSPSEMEFMAQQLKELEADALPADQLARLEQEHRLLAASGDLLKSLATAQACLDADEDGAGRQLGDAILQLQDYAGLDPDIDEACRMLDVARINAQEAQASLQAANTRVDLSPDRLGIISAQLSRLGSLAHKHNASMESLTGVCDQLRERLAEAGQFDERREQLELELSQAMASYRSNAGELSGARQSHAQELAVQVARLMGELGMEGGIFEIDVQHDPEREPAVNGDDRVELRVSANPGLPPAPLSKVASGGELSRISLAIKVATSGATGRSQVFDEIDAGVGGDTANAVGRLLKKVASGAQALCVTHLAQVAVRADQQLRVVKQASGDRTEVDARVLEHSDRVEEIARMLGGTVSEQSRAHATEMLEAAGASLH